MFVIMGIEQKRKLPKEGQANNNQYEKRSHTLSASAICYPFRCYDSSFQALREANEYYHRKRASTLLSSVLIN